MKLAVEFNVREAWQRGSGGIWGGDRTGRPGHCSSHSVFSSGKLNSIDVSQVALLPGRPWWKGKEQGVGQGLVVSEQGEFPPLQMEHWK